MGTVRSLTFTSLRSQYRQNNFPALWFTGLIMSLNEFGTRCNACTSRAKRMPSKKIGREPFSVDGGEADYLSILLGLTVRPVFFVAASEFSDGGVNFSKFVLGTSFYL